MKRSIVNAAECYKVWYKTSGCSSCDDSAYNSALGYGNLILTCYK